MWAAQALLPSAPVYNNAYTFTFAGELEPQHFQRAFQAFVDRTDALRTVFYERNVIPEQRVIPGFSYTVECLDLSKEARPAMALQSWVERRSKNPTDFRKC